MTHRTTEKEFREISVKELCEPISDSEAREYLRNLLENYEVPTEWTDQFLETIRETVREKARSYLADLLSEDVFNEVTERLTGLYIHLAYNMLFVDSKKRPARSGEDGCY